jgi:DNA-binding SARP family transcriptional activator/tetratricopeptide (TPR) repeat protein/transcriptional regulator with XRE-family HTH domain
MGPDGAGVWPHVGVLLRGHRQASGLTQEQLGVLAGVSVGAIRDIEQGRTPAPRADTVARLGTALHLNGDQREALQGPGAGPGNEHRESGSGTARSRSPRRDKAPQTTVSVAVLGSLAAWRDGTRLTLGPPQERAVLGLLALQAGAGLTRAAIVDALWGGDPPQAAATIVQGHITRIRRLIRPRGAARTRTQSAAAAVCWDGTGYQLVPGAIHTDVDDFRGLVERARQAASAEDPAGACRLYEQALALWRGEPLADVEALRGHPAVARLARSRDAAVIEYADAAEVAGVQDRVVGHLLALAGREPLDERAHARLMIALAATGQQAAAFRVYEEVRQRLDADLGVVPGPEVAHAHLRVLRQETGLDAPSLARARYEVPMAGAGDGMNAREGGAADSTWGDGAGIRPHPVVPRQLPAGTPHFAGRDAEFSALDEMASTHVPSRTLLITTVSGGAGVGKTALAVQWAHRVAGQFPDGQLYVNLIGYGPSPSPMGPEMAIRGFLDALQIAPERIPAGLDAQTALYRSLLAGKRMLIVLDNARSADQVRPLLPGSPSCLVVVTSRNQLAGLAAAEGARTLMLDILSYPDARELLKARVGADRVAGEANAADELIGLCARLPLALSVAAARAVRHPGFPLAAIGENLRDEGHRLDALDTRDSSTAVRAVFSWSYRSLTGPAQRLFRLLSVHPGPDITAPAAASLAGIPLRAARAVLGELADSSLVAEHAPGRFACHDLLRTYAAEQARAHDGKAERRTALHRILDHYLHTCYAAACETHPAILGTLTLGRPIPGVTAERLTGHETVLAWCRAEHTVLTAAVSRAADEGFTGHAWQLAWAMDPLFYQRAFRWHDLATAYETALGAAERQGDLTGRAHCHCGLARTRIVLGSSDDVQHHLREALGLFQRLGDPAGQARVHLYVGLALSRQGSHAEAIRRARQAAELFRRAGNRAGQAGALNNVGWYSLQLGNYEQALACCREALAMFRELQDRRGLAIALSSVGVAQYHLGRYADCVACMQHACAILADIGARYDRGVIIADLGDAHYARGDEQAARDAWQQGLDILGPSGGREADQLRAKLRRLGSLPPAMSPGT